MFLKFYHLSIKKFFLYTFVSYLLIGVHITMKHVGGSGLYLPYNIIGWIFICLIIGLGLIRMSKSSKIYLSRNLIYLLIGYVFILTPCFYNNSNIEIALMRMVGLSFGILLLITFYQFRFKKSEIYWLLYIILVSVCIQSILKTIKILVPSLNSIWFLSILNFGSMAHKNVYATFLCTGALTCLYLMMVDNAMYSSKLKIFLVHMTPFLTALQLYHLQSRTGYLSLILGFIFFLPSIFRERRLPSNWVSLLLIGHFLAMISSSEDRTSEEAEYSKNTRILTYKLTFDMIKEKPVLGVGYGNFLSSFRLFYAKSKKDREGFGVLGNNNMDHPHNEILFWTAEGGLLPFLGILVIAGSFISMVWKSKKKDSWDIVGMISPMIIHSMLELPFYISVVHWFLFIFLYFNLDNTCSQIFELRLKYSKLFKILGILFPSFFCGYLITTLQSASSIIEFERTGYNNPNLLKKVSNVHAWDKKYESLIMKLNLSLGIKERNHQKLKEYIQWAEKFIKHSPYLFIYYDLATAYEALGKNEKAWEVYRFAQYLYPGANWEDEE